MAETEHAKDLQINPHHQPIAESAQAASAERDRASAGSDGGSDFFVPHASFPHLHDFDAVRRLKYLHVADSFIVESNTLGSVTQKPWSGSWAGHDGLVTYANPSTACRARPTERDHSH